MKNKERRETISYCSKAWTRRNDPCEAEADILGVEGLRGLVIGCRVTDEKASAVPGVS